MRAVYIVWGLLPLSLLLLVAWALYKKAFKVAGREYPKDYLREALYTLVLLFIAIAFDQTIFESLIYSLTSDNDTVTIIRWMIYPFVLFVVAIAYDAYAKNKRPAPEKKAARRAGGKPANF